MLKIPEYYTIDNKQTIIKVGPIFIDERCITMVEKLFGPEKNCKIPASLAFVYSEYERVGAWAIHLNNQVTFAVDEEIAQGILLGMSSSSMDKSMFG